MMKSIIVLLICLAVGCFGQKPPHPCESPPLLSGRFTMISQKKELWTLTNYIYNAYEQRIRLKQIGSYENMTFTFDGLLYYKEHVMYVINEEDRTCAKQPLLGDFQPLGVPKDAALLGVTTVGSSSLSLEGLDISAWMGETQDKVKYMLTVTMFGCIPVGNIFQTDTNGLVSTSFFDNVLGIENPGDLYPPSYCNGVPLGDEPFDLDNPFRKR